jgi:hypothetical protein
MMKMAEADVSLLAKVSSGALAPATPRSGILKFESGGLSKPLLSGGFLADAVWGGICALPKSFSDSGWADPPGLLSLYWADPPAFVAFQNDFSVNGAQEQAIFIEALDGWPIYRLKEQDSMFCVYVCVLFAQGKTLCSKWGGAEMFAPHFEPGKSCSCCECAQMHLLV